MIDSNNELNVLIVVIDNVKMTELKQTVKQTKMTNRTLNTTNQQFPLIQQPLAPLWNLANHEEEKASLQNFKRVTSISSLNMRLLSPSHLKKSRNPK